MTVMLDLFGPPAVSPAVPGFALLPEIVSAAEEADLVARIDAEALSPFKFQQWTGKRLTCSFGWSYDFQTRECLAAEPIPDWLAPLQQRAAAFAGLAAEALVQALLIRYDPGAGIGWHKDRPVFEHVVGISLGGDASLRLRRREGDGFARTKAELPARSIYQLAGEVRHQWEHSIMPMQERRWSITFRSLSERQGRA